MIAEKKNQLDMLMMKTGRHVLNKFKYFTGCIWVEMKLVTFRASIWVFRECSTRNAWYL